MLVADSQMEAVVSGVLERPDSLRTRGFSYRTIVHPQKDPGVFHTGADLVADSLAEERNVLVLLDREWSRKKVGMTADEMQNRLEHELEVRLPDLRARAIVIDPELDIWMWTTDANMRKALSWKRDESIESWVTRELRELGVTFDAAGKPCCPGAGTGPKEVLEAVLKEARQPRSRSLYREIADTTSLANCTDPAFVRLRETLLDWFPPFVVEPGMFGS